MENWVCGVRSFLVLMENLGFRGKDFWILKEIWIFGGLRYRTEILKLKELPNDGFDTSRGALWLGIGTFYCFKLGDYRPPGAGPKSSN